MTNPKLWWPNGYGPQNLYTLHLSLEIGGAVSDARDVTFGIRKITYGSSAADNLTLSVNGVRVFAKGGDWGMDEAMKRIPRERLEAQIRMHQLANYNIIRNWVGQSTSEDFYDLCDQYGILIWDEFFQPNPGDGPNPADCRPTWPMCAKKSSAFATIPPSPSGAGATRATRPRRSTPRCIKLTAELDPTPPLPVQFHQRQRRPLRRPLSLATPREYYQFPDSEAFKTEIGSVSVPTSESIQGMMPQKDWAQINDDWAEHDLAAAPRAETATPAHGERYGPLANPADFARKGQLMNYEAFRAMYEGRNAKLFHFATGVITWMSNPAQPSFVWQLYHTTWSQLRPLRRAQGLRADPHPVQRKARFRAGHQ